MIHWWVGALASLAAFFSGFALAAALAVAHRADEDVARWEASRLQRGNGRW